MLCVYEYHDESEANEGSTAVARCAAQGHGTAA
jgi:hypothetical protein